MVTVALANKAARPIWALLAYDRAFQPNFVSQPAQGRWLTGTRTNTGNEVAAERSRKVRQGVMASNSDRDPPSLHVFWCEKFSERNEARIGKADGQNAPHQRPNTNPESACPLHRNWSLRPGRRPYKGHENADFRWNQATYTVRPPCQNVAFAEPR